MRIFEVANFAVSDIYIGKVGEFPCVLAAVNDIEQLFSFTFRTLPGMAREEIIFLVSYLISMKMYYHHVGQIGSEDFAKTVFKTIPNSFVRLHAEPEIRDDLGDALDKLFPSGYFNCWGVPSGAGKVIKNLSENDFVLLVKTLNLSGCHSPVLAPLPVLAYSALSGAETLEGRLSGRTYL